MIPRPLDCDGDHCDHNPSGVWVHRAGCLALTVTTTAALTADTGWPPEYLAGWTRRPPTTNRTTRTTA